MFASYMQRRVAQRDYFRCLPFFRSIARSCVAAAAVTVAMLSAPIAVFAAGSGASTEEAAYLSENDKATAKMMDEMSVKPKCEALRWCKRQSKAKN
jgi:hypothetical protein